MNLQTEAIEGHRAQLTVAIDAQEFDAAKRAAARKISRQVNIRGFRRGKAPYGPVVRRVGEATIIEEAVETLSDTLYKEALNSADIAPYGAGLLEDFKLEPAPTFVYTVPLQPEVDLGDYLSLRVEEEPAEVQAKDVDKALQAIRLRAVEVLDDALEVAQIGNRVSLSVAGEFLDDAPDPAQKEGYSPYYPSKGESFVQDDNAVFILDPNNDPYITGFAQQVAGAKVGSELAFDLTIPEDNGDETLAGRKVGFTVTLQQAEAVSLPALDDDFARKHCREHGFECQDLAGLRAQTLQDLQRQLQEETKSNYARKVLKALVELAEIRYPERVVQQQIQDMIHNFERELAQQRIKLEDYYRMTNSSEKDLQERYRKDAEAIVRRGLVLGEFSRAQCIELSEEDINTRMQQIMPGLSLDSASSEPFVKQMRDYVRNELFAQVVDEHLRALGRGHDAQEAVAAFYEAAAANAQREQERRERLRQLESADDDTPSAGEPAATDASDPATGS